MRNAAVGFTAMLLTYAIGIAVGHVTCMISADWPERHGVPRMLRRQPHCGRR
jgi:hypothetical protein